MEKTQKKIINRILFWFIIILTVALVMAAILVAWLYYLYHHPEKLKPQLEKQISRLANVSCRIDELDFTLNPITISLKGINIDKPDEFSLQIGDLNLEMVRAVKDDRQKLIIQEITMTDLSSQINKLPSFSQVLPERTGLSSFFLAFLNKLKKKYLFQDLELGRLNIDKGLIDIQSTPPRITISNLMARIDMSCHSEMTFGLRVEYDRDNVLNISEVRFLADTSRMLQQKRLHLDLSTHGFSYAGPLATAEKMALQASFEYDHRQRSIFLETASFASSQIRFNPGTSHESYSPPFDFKARGEVHLQEQSLQDMYINLDLGSLMRLEGVLKGRLSEKPGLSLDIKQGRILPEELRPFLPAGLQNTLDPFHLDGYINLSGQVRVFEQQDLLCLEGHLKTDFAQNRFALQHNGLQAQGRIKGTLWAHGTWPDLDIKAEMKISQAGIEHDLFRIKTEELDLMLEGQHPFYKIPHLSGKITSLYTQSDQREYFLENIRFQSRNAEIDLASNHFHVPGLEFSSPLLQKMALDFTLKMDEENQGKYQDPGSWHIDLRGNFNELNLNFHNNSLESKGFLSGNFQGRGQWPDYRASVRMEAREARVTGPWGSFDPTDLKLTLQVRHPHYHLQDLSGALAAAVTLPDKNTEPLGDVTFVMPAGHINLHDKSLDIPELKLSSQPLGPALLSLTGRADDLKITLKSQDSQLLKSAVSFNLLPAGWQLDASETFEIEASLQEKLYVTFRSEFTFNKLSLANNDATIIGEDMSLATNLNGRLDMENGTLEIDLDLLGQTGELLADQFYFNLSPNPLRLHSRLKADMSGERLDVSQFDLNWQDIISFNLNGQVRNMLGDPVYDFNLLLPRTPIKPLFQNFIQEPFQSKRAVLRTLNIDGHLTADLNLKGTRVLEGLTGLITLFDVDFDLADHGLDLKGVNLEFPLWYEKQTREKSESALKGSLAIEALSGPWVPVQSLTLDFEVTPNKIGIAEPTEIIIPGGVARIGPVRGHDLFANPVIETSLSLNNIDLNPWTEANPLFNIQGTLNGQLKPVVFTLQGLESDGKLTADVAGGRIILSNFNLSNLNTPTPVFGLDGSLHDLDLNQLTTNSSFGRIQGRLEGYINNLEIAYGQPQRFDLLLETVKEQGVPQRISVEAVENIAQLGGGHSPFIGLAGVYITFLKDFPYEKIGLRSSLRNDVFRINGTIKDGDLEYIVKRGLYGVNIINKDPNNNIRFREMVNRIKNLDLAETKPVIQ